MSDVVDAWLLRLSELWRAERATARRRFREARDGATLATRVARGLALAQLTVSDFRPAAGGRTRVWLTPPRTVDLGEVRLGPGDPIVLWRQAPTEPDVVRGVIARPERGELIVLVTGDLPDAIVDAGCNLDVEAPESSFERGDRAIARARAAKPTSALARMLDVLHGQRPAARRRSTPWTSFDRDLDDAQRAAVDGALHSDDVALIHGPPGTGKTRTLVEVIRHAVAAGQQVLVTAPSNTAVDNLGERLLAAGVAALRLGHPARIAPALEARSLDALVAASDGARLARDLGDRARDERRAALATRGADARDRWAEVRALERDARAALAEAEAHLLATAPVLLATCAGADHHALGDRVFPLVVIDEATQAPDPLALVALARGERVVLAGDPHQLPPTVLDPDAARAGLGTTLFERRAAAAGAPMLVQQHRMHADIMAFPSVSKYGGALVAAPAVGAHTLIDLGVVDDPERGQALWLLDTAGKDWTDRRGGPDEGEADRRDPSTWNPEQAERIAREVRRLLGRGLAPTDLAVIAAYDAQVRRLRALLARERAAGLEIATVDGFQGREKEAVIVDTVRSNPDGELGFLTDTRRMNVALTRARRFLLVVGDSATLAGHPYYQALLASLDARDLHGSAWADDGDPIAG
ncbi:MAG: AAA family ATPase [Kofleriaceae bacterium]|nr:AAA family ATPase [Kofleriaceae bacterium]MBP9166031.1 AAA family ATPase [Kofleriaceae bacterium]MBP9857290.1 AAA family ATPase [Kofleriaceae bacterium]